MTSRLALAATVRRFVPLTLAVLAGAPIPVAALASRMPIVADNIVIQRDVIYGRPDGAAVLADIAYPEAGKGLPAIIYVHGGRWTSGERVGRLRLYVEDCLNTKDVEKARCIASPIHQITPKTRPTLIIHSDDDQSVPIQQALDMVAALTKAGIKHKFVRFKDRGHMRLTDEVVNEMLAFIGHIEGRTRSDVRR